MYIIPYFDQDNWYVHGLPLAVSIDELLSQAFSECSLFSGLFSSLYIALVALDEGCFGNFDKKL